MVKYVVLALIAGLSTYFLKENIILLSYSVYKETLSALLNISSIIFAIIGAWIAIIYPRAIGRAFKGTSITDGAIKEADTDADYLSELVEIVMVSAIVLMIVLAVQFAVPLLKTIQLNSWLNDAKYFAFFLVFMLTTSQLYAVFRVILANYFFLNALRKKNVNGKVDTLHK